MGRGVGRGVGAAVLVGTAVGASVACKIVLCRSSSAGARAAFPRKLCRGTSAGADASLLTDFPVACWPNQKSRPINNRGMGFLVLLVLRLACENESIQAFSGVVLNDVARTHGPGAQNYAATQIARAQEAWLELKLSPLDTIEVVRARRRTLRARETPQELTKYSYTPI